MVDMNVRCPRCGEIVSFSGVPGERRVVSCPSCGTAARLSFPGGDVQISENAIEVSHLRKVYDFIVRLDSVKEVEHVLF